MIFVVCGTPFLDSDIPVEVLLPIYYFFDATTTRGCLLRIYDFPLISDQ